MKDSSEKGVKEKVVAAEGEGATFLSSRIFGEDREEALFERPLFFSKGESKLATETDEGVEESEEAEVTVVVGEETVEEVEGVVEGVIVAEEEVLKVASVEGAELIAVVAV